VRTNSGKDALEIDMRRRRSGMTSALAMAALAFALFAGCAATPATPTATQKAAVRVATLKGPTGVGMVQLMQAQQADTAANNYTFTVSDAPDEVAAKLASGDVDIAAVPTNLGAALYAKTSGGVQMLAVNTLGVMYIVENGSVIQSLADLKGKTIYASGQGSNPEFVLRFLLQKNGLDPDIDVDIVFKSQHDEVATLVASGKAGIALLPEPFVTAVMVKNPGVQVALDLTKEWAKVVTDGSQLMMGAVIARKDFVANNPAAVASFLAEYKASIGKASTDVDGTAALCQQFGIIPSAAVAKLAMPRLGLTFVDGAEMVSGVSGYFQVLYAANPKAVGGAIPDSGFYYTAK
jgi:NitT/TauT family transport system substrate-binding protein